MTGGDGSTWTKNADGTVTIVDKDGVSYTVNPNQTTGDTTGDTTSGGQRYSGVVYGEPDDGQGERYKISSASGLDFLNNKPAGSSMTGGDMSYWVKTQMVRLPLRTGTVVATRFMTKAASYTAWAASRQPCRMKESRRPM